MLTKRELLRSAALATVAVAANKSAPVLAQTSTNRPGFFAAKDIAEAGFIYGLPIVMNYGVMYEYAIDRNSGQFKAPFNQIHNEANVFTYKDTAVVTHRTATHPIPCFSWICGRNRSSFRFRPSIPNATTRCSSATAIRTTMATSEAARQGVKLATT